MAHQVRQSIRALFGSAGAGTVPVAEHERTYGWLIASRSSPVRPVRHRPVPCGRCRTARSSSSSPQPVAVGGAAGRPSWALTRQDLGSWKRFQTMSARESKLQLGQSQISRQSEKKFPGGQIPQAHEAALWRYSKRGKTFYLTTH